MPEIPSEFPNPPGENYLREALTKTLGKCGDLVFDFLIQVQEYSDELQIEDASAHWDESVYEFKKVAEILITAPYDPADCEALEFNPWHCLSEHQPIGGINRLRESVYLVSSEHRNK